MLSRATFIPVRINISKFSTSQHEGPIVQMIFVRRWIVFEMFGLVIIAISIIPPAKVGISEECEIDMMILVPCWLLKLFIICIYCIYILICNASNLYIHRFCVLVKSFPVSPVAVNDVLICTYQVPSCHVRESV